MNMIVILLYFTVRRGGNWCHLRVITFGGIWDGGVKNFQNTVIVPDEEVLCQPRENFNHPTLTTPLSGPQTTMLCYLLEGLSSSISSV